MSNPIFLLVVLSNSLQDLTHLSAGVLFGAYDYAGAGGNNGSVFGVLGQLALSVYMVQSVRCDDAAMETGP